jgi:hypothetical protein
MHHVEVWLDLMVPYYLTTFLATLKQKTFMKNPFRTSRVSGVRNENLLQFRMFYVE